MNEQQQEAMDKLSDLVQTNTAITKPGTEGAVSNHFFTVAKTGDITGQELAQAIFDAPVGYYATIEPTHWMSGPSYIGPTYILVGAWIGDQGRALALFGLGEILGLWKVITPEAFFIFGKDADDMAGSGFVMVSVTKDGPLETLFRGVAVDAPEGI